MAEEDDLTQLVERESCRHSADMQTKKSEFRQTLRCCLNSLFLVIQNSGSISP